MNRPNRKLSLRLFTNPEKYELVAWMVEIDALNRDVNGA